MANSVLILFRVSKGLQTACVHKSQVSPLPVLASVEGSNHDAKLLINVGFPVYVPMVNSLKREFGTGIPFFKSYLMV